MDYRFCCFGTYRDLEIRCLKTCPDRYVCKRETEALNILKLLKYSSENITKERINKEET